MCPEDEIIEVTLYRFHGNVVGDDDDEVLWKASGEASVNEVEIGVPPQGFSEDVALTESDWKGESLAGSVDTSLGGSFATTFTLDELVAGRILHEGTLKTLEAFVEDASPQCS